MKNKNIKRILAILLLMVTLLSFGCNTFVSAVSINNAYIQKIGDAANHLKYDGHYVQVSVVGHNTNGVFYPAYCLNKDLNRSRNRTL